MNDAATLDFEGAQAAADAAIEARLFTAQQMDMATLQAPSLKPP